MYLGLPGWCGVDVFVQERLSIQLEFVLVRAAEDHKIKNRVWVACERWGEGEGERAREGGKRGLMANVEENMTNRPFELTSRQFDLESLTRSNLHVWIAVSRFGRPRNQRAARVGPARTCGISVLNARRHAWHVCVWMRPCMCGDGLPRFVP